MELQLDHNQTVKAIMAEFTEDKDISIQWQDDFKPNMIYGRYELRYEKDKNKVLARTHQ